MTTSSEATVTAPKDGAKATCKNCNQTIFFDGEMGDWYHPGFTQSPLDMTCHGTWGDGQEAEPLTPTTDPETEVTLP